MRKVQDLNAKNKKVLVRVDYNVPMKAGKVSDNERIRASIETINFLLRQEAAVVLCSHLGRPNGQHDKKLSLEPIAKELSKLIKKSVQFCPVAVGKEKDQMVNNIKPGEVVLLENLRFYPGEEKNLRGFADNLAKGFDSYVNDAFSSSHRAHASIEKVAEILKGYGGFSLQEEVENLSKLTDKPKHPFVLIQGGAKVSDKVEVLKNLLPKVDVLILGGAVANTVFLAKGEDIGASIAEPESVEAVKSLLSEADKKNVEVMLPVDFLVGKKLDDKKAEKKDIREVNYKDIILDIGPETIKNYLEPLEFAETVFWNGPLGYCENKVFSQGTEKIGHKIVKENNYSVAGGGDTVAALPDSVKEKFDFISTAGGASLEFLAGKKLPGLKVLENNFSLLTIFRI